MGDELRDKLARNIREALGDYNDDALPVVMLVKQLAENSARPALSGDELRDPWLQTYIKSQADRIEALSAEVADARRLALEEAALVTEEWSGTYAHLLTRRTIATAIRNLIGEKL